MKYRNLFRCFNAFFCRHSVWMLALVVSLTSIAAGASAVMAMATVSEGYAADNISCGEGRRDREQEKQRAKAAKERAKAARKRAEEARKRAAEANKRAEEARKRAAEANKRAEEARKRAEEANKRGEEARKRADKLKDKVSGGLSGNSFRSVGIKPFESVQASLAVEVIYTQGEFDGFAQIVSDESNVGRVSVTVEGNVLNVTYIPVNQVVTAHPVVYVTAPVLNAINLSTAAVFTANGPIRQNKPLHISVNAASSVNLGEVNVPSLYVDATSAASVYALTVEAGEIDVKASSASTVRLKGMDAGILKAVATSASDVTLSGRCREASISESGEGNVKSRGMIIEDGPVNVSKKRDNRNDKKYRLREP